jgi:hypothetical protein
MTKKRYLGFVLMGMAVGLNMTMVGCAGRQLSDAVGPDLVQYTNQGILSIAVLEKEALADYAAVIGPNYISDEKVLKSLKDSVIPKYKDFLSMLGQVKTQTEEVARLHRLYVNGAEKMFEGFRLKLMGLERNDARTIQSANQIIENGRLETEQWRENLKNMYVTYGVIQK